MQRTESKRRFTEVNSWNLVPWTATENPAWNGIVYPTVRGPTGEESISHSDRARCSCSGMSQGLVAHVFLQELSLECIQKIQLASIIIKESTGLKNFCSFFAILSVNVIESTLNYLDGWNHRRVSSTFPAWMWKAHATILSLYSVPHIVPTQNRCCQIILWLNEQTGRRILWG